MSEPVEFAATVLDIRLESRVAGQSRWQVALDRTLFAPGSAGELEAIARSGARLVIPVQAVLVDEAGTVWHVVEKPLVEGTQVTGRVSA